MNSVSGLLHNIDWHWIWLSLAAFLAGVLNAVAGGGSFLLFPAMLGMKMLPVQANATNTVALWPGQLTSIAAYREDIVKNRRLAWPMGLAGLVGGTTGALVLLNTPQTTFLHLVPWLLLVSALIFAATGPVTSWLDRRKAAAGEVTHPPRLVSVFLSTIFVCFYIGYFGAGAGFLIITLLSLFGFQRFERDQRAQSGGHHHGQRRGVSYLRDWPPGGVALLPARHGHMRHWRLQFGAAGAQGAADSSARAGGVYWPGDGRLVLLEKPIVPYLSLIPRWALDLIGSVAAVCTTVSFVPQLVRVWRRKSAADISLSMFLLFSFGVACWLVFGICLGSVPVIAANAVTLALALAILALKIKYR